MNASHSGSGRQLVFDLARAPSYDSEDFLESASNTEALALVERWPDWPDRTLLLAGPPGSGKSHLGAIWARRAEGRIVRIGDKIELGALGDPCIALLEDVDRAGHEEAQVFHLINQVRESRGWLLLTARTPPAAWGIQTADLLSRLRLAPLVPIGHADANLMQAVIVKLFADRQIRIDEDVVAYAARHCEQSLEAVNAFVAAVDEESLVAGRRITRPLAARAIAALGHDLPESDEPRDQGPT